MRVSMVISVVVLSRLLAGSATSAQRVEPTFDWPAARPVVADTATIYSLPLPGQPPELGRLEWSEPDQQLQRYASPKPFVIGGLAIGLFGGGVIGYAACVAGDGDCSALLRTAVGGAIGTFLGAVFWLGIAPQP